MNFSERVALITGAGSALGIGFATARLLAQYGAKIAITSTTDRINERARELAADKADVFAMPADLRDRASTEMLVREVLARYGGIDVLVNNAGMTQVSNPDETLSTSFAEFTKGDWIYTSGLN